MHTRPRTYGPILLRLAGFIVAIAGFFAASGGTFAASANMSAGETELNVVAGTSSAVTPTFSSTTSTTFPPLSRFEMFATITASDDADTLVRINPDSGAQSLAGPIGLAPHATALDWNPTTCTLFASDLFGNPGEIREIDPATGLAKLVATIRQDGIPVDIGALAFAADGTLYGVGGANVLGLTLGTIDLNRESFTALLPIPTGMFVTGIDISPDGILYAVYSNQKQTLVTIDLATLAVTSEKELGSLTVGEIDYAPDGFIYTTNFSFFLVRIVPATGYQVLVGEGALGALEGIATPQKCSICCLVATAKRGGNCKDQKLPPAVDTRLNRAIGLAQRAPTSTRRKANRLVQSARRILRSAAKAARKAAKGRQPELSKECAQDVQKAIAQARATLAP